MESEIIPCTDVDGEDPQYHFTLAEVKAIYRIIEHEWISRDDEEAMDVTKKVSKIANGR